MLVDVPALHAAFPRPDVLVDSAEASALALRVDTYAEVGEGQYGLLEDAWGWVMVIRYEANASGGVLVGRDDPAEESDA